MLLVLLQKLTNQVSGIFREKSLKFGATPIYHKMVGAITILTIIIGVAIYSKVELSSYTSILLLTYVVVAAIASIGDSITWQIALKLEKSSDMYPFAQSFPLMVILLSFFILPDQSIISFSIAIVAALIVFLSAIDFKKGLKLSKGAVYVLIGCLLGAIETVFVGFILIEHAPPTILLGSTSVMVVILIIMYLSKNKFSKDKLLPFKYYKLRMSAALLNGLAIIGTLYLIQKIGLIEMTLIGFIGILSRMILWKIFMNDSPSKKSIIVALVLACLAFLGNYFA